MRRVRANANVGRDGEIRRGVFHGVDRARNDVIALAREQRELVLPVRRGEDQEAGETRRRRLARVAHELGDGKSLEERRVGHALAILDARRNDDRLNETPDDLRRGQRAGPQRMVTEPAADQCRRAHRRMVRVCDAP